MKKTYIIAEAGVNHNGSIELALELINKAKEVGADCVKFQTFKAESIVTKESPKANYQLLVTDKNESQFDMLKKLELRMNDYSILIERCKTIGIDFLSTPYNIEDAELLNSLNVEGFKIASGQLTETYFLKQVARMGKKMIISTGMANMAEVFLAVEAIRSEGNNDIVVLQCTTNYPSRIEDSNLLSMISIKNACSVVVGYSDHVINNYACYASVALGAEYLEKHFTLDKNLPGPDHSCSLNPQEFKDLVEGVRNIEKSLGSSIKRPSQIEIENSFGMRRSLVVLSDLKAGSVLTPEIIGFKRPSNGLAPNMYEQILGKSILNDMKKDEAIHMNSIKW